jgi:hypothetical protein
MQTDESTMYECRKQEGRLMPLHTSHWSGVQCVIALSDPSFLYTKFFTCICHETVTQSRHTFCYCTQPQIGEIVRVAGSTLSPSSLFPNLPPLVTNDHWERIRTKFSLLDLFDAQFFKPLQVVETDPSPYR